MSFQTLFISGPPQGGKSTVARMIADQVLDRPTYFLRMQLAADGHTNALLADDPPSEDLHGAGCVSVHTVSYTAERVFETLPDGLRAVRKKDHLGFAIIEADEDPNLRHAYPYDYRVFVMGVPVEMHTVFRSPDAAAVALQQVMQDTAGFAAEIFGLFDPADLEDSAGVHHHQPMQPARQGKAVETLEVDEIQIRQFLKSPLGAEIASRIQLQPEYHALVESDVVVINTGTGVRGVALNECVKRIEKLLARIRHDARRYSLLFWGDVTNTQDPNRNKLIRRLQALIHSDSV